MREILFRGKRVDNGEWVYGDLITKPIHHECVILENGCINYSVIPETVGQYIGLNDMEGKQIYFGDIVTDGQRNFLIKWSGQNAAFYMGHTDGKRSFYKEFIECGQSQSDGPVQCDTIKVIGNIHEPLTLNS